MAKLADLLSVEEAQEHVLARFQQLEPETCALENALGRTLAESVVSTMALPPFDNSSMDGFALRTEDVRLASMDHPVSLRVVETVAAGVRPSLPVYEGHCARIMTGAPVPHGADAVVPFEEVEEHRDTIVLRVPVTSTACIRPAGNDVHADVEVLERGTVLGSRHIALLAAIGNAEIPVTRRPTVAILSTGDELVQPGRALQPGQIYNSNTPMLAAAAVEAGGVPSVLHSTGDTVDALTEALHSAVETGADLIITSGGASVGDFDHVKTVLQQRGAINFWRVRLRPGKPLILGEFEGTTLLGLPGNPTSAMVTFELFVWPAIRRMLGAQTKRTAVEVVLDDYIDNRGGRRTFARVVVEPQNGALHARLSGSQDSAMLLPLVRANALLVIPEERENLRPGDSAFALLWP